MSLYLEKLNGQVFSFFCFAFNFILINNTVNLRLNKSVN